MALISNRTPFDLDLGLKGTHVLVTGGCGMIGKHVAHAFLAAGSKVSIIDLVTDDQCPFDQSDKNVLYQRGDITDVQAMDNMFAASERAFGTVEVCVALASLDLSVLEQTESLADMDPKVWQRTFDVNINGTFMTCQRWLRSIRKAASSPESAAELRNVSLIIMGSESGRFGVRTMAAYAAGKSAVQYGLMYSLALDAPRIFPRARVNAIAPGAVETERFKVESKEFGAEWRWRECEATYVYFECTEMTIADKYSVPMAKPIPPEDVARTILFLASERYSGSVHGQLIPIDAGKGGNLVWTQDELKRRGGT